MVQSLHDCFGDNIWLKSPNKHNIIIIWDFIVSCWILVIVNWKHLQMEVCGELPPTVMTNQTPTYSKSLFSYLSWKIETFTLLPVVTTTLFLLHPQHPTFSLRPSILRFPLHQYTYMHTENIMLEINRHP